jgi:hypothetical protein
VSSSNIIPPAGTAPIEQPAPQQTGLTGPAHRHFVVVMTRRAKPADEAPPGIVMLTRFWHPRDRKWSENSFESLDHALRLFVDETGWTLVQQQQLAGDHEHELIFQARIEDFQGPSTEEILKEVGLTPADVKELLDGDQ